MLDLLPAPTVLIRKTTNDCRAPALRSMLQFAEEEIVLPPPGPFQGKRFRADRQPFARHLLNEIDSMAWVRHCITGCVQDGKSTLGYVIPILYYTLEWGEDVIAGVPDMAMAEQKWLRDLKPVIERTRYRKLMPTEGAGSKGGKFESIRFRNGALLTFMSYRGGDANRSGATARIICLTEVDKCDRAAAGSRETDPIQQIESRAEAFDDYRRRIFEECTTSTKYGRIWIDYNTGSASRVLLWCPICGAHVLPEREHLIGWQDAQSEKEARMLARFSCPSCGGPWTEEHRVEANHRSVIVHKGQTVDKRGRVVGERPPTDTLGFRWNASHNLLRSAGSFGAAEWKARYVQEMDEQGEDQESRQRKLIQFVWVQPYEPPALEVTHLEVAQILRRQSGEPRGIVPEWASTLTLGGDLGKYEGHWVLTAWSPDARGHVVDYGVFEIQSKAYGVERATSLALDTFHEEIIVPGWGDQEHRPSFVLFDSRYSGEQVRNFCRSKPGYYPTIGFASSHRIADRRRYTQPKQVNKEIMVLGDNYNVVKRASDRIVNINADYWKIWLMARLSVPQGEAGSMSLFHAAQNSDHYDFARHLTAERQIEEFVANHGTIQRMEPLRRQNHFLDAFALSCVAAHMAKIRLCPAVTQNAAADKYPHPRAIQQSTIPSYIEARRH